MTFDETVSVVIPYYNGGKFIAEALDSVAAQTFPAHEIIVVDDGSKPEQAAKLDEVARGRERVVVVHLDRNRGACVARNVGISRATGRWIALLDCDDLWEPKKLERQMEFLRTNPGYKAVHTGLKATGSDGQEIIAHKQEVTFQDLVHFPCPAFPSAVIMERQALFECGLFNPTKRACQDLDLFLRFTSQYPIGCVDEPLVVRRVQDDSISRNVPVFWHEADRVYRDYRYVFKDDDAAQETLTELHADFLMRAFYKRDPSFAWKVLRRATRQEVTVPGLLARTVQGLVKNRLQRASKSS